MQTKIRLMLILTWISLAGTAQERDRGLYFSVSDFKSGHPSVRVNCHYGKRAIRVGDFFLHPYLYVYVEDQKVRVPMEQVYAFQACDDQVYRLWKGKAYMLCDSSGLRIYRYTDWVTQKVSTSRMLHFRKERVTTYFFSLNDSTPLVSLTPQHVLDALGNDETLRQLITETFPSARSLRQRDGDSFVLNRVLGEYLTK